MKIKPNAFSIIKYNDLVEMNDDMNWNLPEDLLDINTFNPKLIRIPDSILRSISNELTLKAHTIAKKDIEYQSNYGHIIAELYNSYCHNSNLNIATEEVYGTLTTGINWQWWKYDGK
ncbi:unnamed protein product [Cunninghamella echinulata]